jgi:hypothetical protein
MFNSLFAKIKQNHFLAMAICCATPLIAILALSSLGVLGSWGYYALLLLCPLGHLLMMRGMHAGHEAAKAQPEIKQIEYK